MNDFPIVFLVIVVILIILLLKWFFTSPFKYPYKEFEIDITGKRTPSDEDVIDRFIIKYGFSPFSEHFDYVESWKEECQERIARSCFKKQRMKQYLACLDGNNMFQFRVFRFQKRYKQVNYVKTSYYVKTTVSWFVKSYSDVEGRYNKLKDIDFECTLSEYFAKDQRKRMNKQLRMEIAQRDNFTCQICGKYMPDGVGLQIDHIIPIAKGGKSVPSNLQVLCSKCNLKKSKK